MSPIFANKEFTKLLQTNLNQTSKKRKKKSAKKQVETDTEQF